MSILNNNDILTRLRYALDIKDAEMVEIFALGGLETTKAEVQDMLSKYGWRNARRRVH